MSGGPALEFSLQPDGSRVILKLASPAPLAFGWLSVDGLELEVPGLTPPVEITGGAARLRRRRCRVTHARFAADEAGLQVWARRRAAALLDAGIDELGLRVLEGWVEISARARAGSRSAEMTARAIVSPAGRGVRVSIDDVRLYGWIGRPAHAIAHDLATALFAAGPVAATPEAPRVSGPATVDAMLLEGALMDLLPPAGWRIPDARSVTVVEARAARGRLQIVYGSGGAIAAQHPSSRISVADARLIDGDSDGAAAGYHAALAAGEEPALERLLSLLAGSPATLAEADRRARQALARDPDSVPALLARAAVALAGDRAAEAAALYARLGELAEDAGDDEDAVRAALAAARTGGAADPTRLYERVFDRRPLHAEAAEALAERYAAAGRWADLIRLAHRRIASSSDRREQAREHARAGEIYLNRLADPVRARDELQRAAGLHDRDPRTWDLLARALEAVGDRAGTTHAIERQVQLFAAKGDVLGEARAHLRAGRLWERAGERASSEGAEAAAPGDDERAHVRYRRAVALMPGDPEALERLAVVAGRRGERDESIAAWERLAEIAVTDDVRRRRALRELARHLIAAGDLDRARAALRHATGGAPSEEAEGSTLAAALAEKLPPETDETVLRLAAARSRLAEGDAVAALALAVAAAARAPEVAAPVLGEAAWRARAWPRVVEAYRLRIAAGIRDDAGVEAAGRLAIALEQLGQADEAMAVHRAIADHPGASGDPLRNAQRRLADLHERRADRHRRAGDPARAIDELEAALRLVPDHLPSLDALESIHAEAGDAERVAAILGRKIAATARQPDKQKALLARLANLQETTLGRPDVAREIRKRIEDLDRKTT